jgi:hypothetical protein
VSGGEAETLFSVDTEISGTGRLVNPTLAAVGTDGRFVVTTALQEEEPPRPLVLGILRIAGSTRSFTEIARIGMTLAGETIVDLDALGIDDQGAVLYLATTRVTEGEEEDETPRPALRLFDGTTSVDVAIQGEQLPGSEEFVIELRDPHFNRRGEAAFVAELGDIVQTPNGPTTTIRGTDLLVRSRGGVYSTRLPAEEPEEGVILEPAQLTAFDDTGTLLAIGSREEDNDELLILVPPPVLP